MIDKKGEDAPAPVSSNNRPNNEYSDCVFFCFDIDQKIFNAEYFIIESTFPNLSKEVFRYDNLTILRIYLDGYLNYALSFFSSKYNFKIIYREGINIYYRSNDFEIEKSKVKFIYELSKYGSISSNSFSCPSYLDQFKTYEKLINKVEKNEDLLFSSTIDFLTNYLDMELYLYLLDTKENKIQSLLEILDNYPYIKLLYKRNKLLQKINFEKIKNSNNNNYNLLIIIFSIINDSFDLLNDFKEEDLKKLFQYNETQKDAPLIVKKNIFEFFAKKTNKADYLKKICKSCESIPLLFKCLLDLDKEKTKEIKNLTIDDLPENISKEDDIIELIEQYDKIKEMFSENEINKLWKKYLTLLYKVKKIEELEIIRDKLISYNKDNCYQIIIDEINIEIINKGKNMINKQTFSSLDFYKFINKYNSIDDFLSDANLLSKIGCNINLKELEKNEAILEEFNKCKFFNRINSNNISWFINGTLNNVNNFEDLELFFKYIYHFKEIDEDNYEKHFKVVHEIKKRLIFLLNKISNIQITELFKEILKKVFLLSIMYENEEKNENYISLISNLGNYFQNEQLINLYIDIFINQDIKKYISDQKKDDVCKYIFENCYDNTNLSIEKKIDLLMKIKSIEIKEKYILNKIPELKFEDILKDENTDTLNYLENLINKKAFEDNEMLNSSYYTKIKNNCNQIKEILEGKKINFGIVNHLYILLVKKPLFFTNRLKCICLGDPKKLSELKDKMKEYIKKYRDYYYQLDNINIYYNKYYPKSKKEEIEKYKEQKTYFNEAKKNICDIELDENIKEKIKAFEQYDKSKLFGIFYNSNNFQDNNLENNDEEIKNDEENKFNKAKETFNECEKLFKGEEMQISLLEQALKKLDEKEIGEEIAYLKKFFEHNNSDEKKIAKELIFYKNKESISNALKSLKFIVTEIIIINNIENFISEIDRIVDDINTIQNLENISNIINRLNDFNENLLDNTFIEILNIFYQKDELLNFLVNKTEGETRDLIDGLFDSENDVITIELKDIEILINVVCFVQDLKRKVNNIKIFLKNYYSLLNDQKYKEIVSNVIHVDNKYSELQDFIRIQLGKNYKYSADIEKFLEKGIIEISKQKVFSFYLMALSAFKIDKDNLFFDATIRIENKELSFETFKEMIKKIIVKNIYKYGKYKNNLLKVQLIAQLLEDILKELNINKEQEFNQKFIVSNFKFIEKGTLKLPELEKLLSDLKKQNYQIKKEDPLIDAFFTICQSDLYDYSNDLKNKEKIENFFPNVQEIEEKEDIIKGIHKHYNCDGCGMKPIVGIRYRCKECKNFDYCENCMEKNINIHKHQFEKIEKPVEDDEITGFLQLLYIITTIKSELNYLKGIFFYKSSKDNFELDILKIYNTLLRDVESDNLPLIFTKKLPLFCNLLLCYDNPKKDKIYSFCVKAISCKTNNLFIIVRPEELKIGEEKFFFKSFNQLLKKNNNKINSCIIVLYINQNSHIIKQLKSIKEKYEFPKEPPLFKTISNSSMDLTDLPVEVVTSDSPHVGKTTYIYNQRFDINTHYYTITLGDIDETFLDQVLYEIYQYIKELSQSKNDNKKEEEKKESNEPKKPSKTNEKDEPKKPSKTNEKDEPKKPSKTDEKDEPKKQNEKEGELNKFKESKYIIVIELYENQNEKTYNLIRNFLFQFLILKYYKDFYYLMRDIKIFIEVSSDYTNTFCNDFKILKLFKNHHIQFKNNLNFYENNKINIQNMKDFFMVLNCLKLLKDGSINEERVSFDLFIKSLTFCEDLIDKDYDSLIKEYFINNYTVENRLPNYGQIRIFADYLGYLISNLNACPLMSIEELKKKQKAIPILKNIRGSIIKAYVKFVKKFSSLTYDSILENQEIAAENQKKIGYEELSKQEKEYLINKLNKKKIVSYNEIEPSLVLFNNIPKNQGNKDYSLINPCSILTIYDNKDKKYEYLNTFYNNYLKLNDLSKVTDLNGEEIFFELCNICLTPTNYHKDIKEKTQKYEFTTDNYVKMVLIYLRVKANIPLILMGETGCGKTSLIDTLVLFLQGQYKLVKFNIHSGLSYYDIMRFLRDEKLVEYPEDLLRGKKDDNINREKIILFLDEINTTNSINLLCDLFKKRKFLGLHLKDNVYVIGACNPYRLMLSNNEEIGYRNKKLQKVRNLVYTVNPLPLSLINYVFDFGNLKDEDEKKYIQKFVHSFLDNRFSKSNNENYAKILDIIIEAVHTCQKFIRENSEISSVSLREIQRFSLFFEFFYNITLERNEFKTADFSFLKDESIFTEGLSQKGKIENIVILKSANLSLFMCYYLRIINTEKREKLNLEMSKILKFDFLDYPLRLEKELADNINLEKGIAKNRALLDNLFSIFVCLNNKVPVFICGKAGCSKSLSFSLLYESMKGEHSKSELFRKYPKIYLTSYQGSLTSSSKEIEIVFKNAKKIIENNGKKNKILSVILFDEMGLAEISPNNPLKVLHSELDGKQEIGFVGISNWTLDASKMNRGIHLSVQEPNLDDLILTSNTISTDIYEDIKNINTYKAMIENLTKSYYEYKEYIKKYYKSNYDFHGARDFYYLIKIAAHLLKINDKARTLENIAMESIERNFGGLELDKEEDNKIWMSTKKFKQIFSKIQNNYIEDKEKYDIFSCIKNNLENKNNRYLLLITNKTKNDTLIEHILQKLQKQYRFIQGSKLKEDQNENYVLQKAWSIISSMENGEIIILKDMEIVYPKFYDLFNKNLQRFGNAQYARIVLDSTKNERHIVHQDFRCIILLDQSQVDEQDSPFLNRFEKHIMSFRYLLTEKQNHIADELYQEILDLTTIPIDKEKIKYKPMLVNINEEEIRCLILDLSTKVDNVENNLEQIYKILIPTFTQENILNSLFSPQKKYIKKEDLIKIYEENTHTNIYKFLETVKNNKLMIYTFSPNNIDIFSEKNNIIVKNEKFGTMAKDNTVEIIFNSKLSEDMIKYFFQLYYEKDNLNLFIIHFKVKDTKYLKYIKFRLDDFLKENKENEKKIFLFIIHIEKNYKKDSFDKSIEYLEKYHSYFFSFLSEYKQITIDNLLVQRDISVINLFNKTNEELLVTKELFDINEIIKKEFSRQMLQMSTNQSMNDIIEKKLDALKENGILNTIINKIQNSIKNSDNILRKILRDYSSLSQKDTDFISYLIEQTELLVSTFVGKLISELGRSGYLVSYLFEKEIPPKLQKPIFSFINNINLNRDISNGNNLEDYSLDLRIPGSRLLIKTLSNLVINCKIDYLNKEDNIRKGTKKSKKSNDDLKTLEDVHYEKKQYLKSRLYNEELLTEDIFSEYSQDILRDVFTFYFYDPNTKKTINEKQKDFLFFIYSKKLEGDNVLDNFLYFFLWIGSYRESVIKILDIFNKFDKYFKVEEKNLNIKLGHSKQSLLNSLKEEYDSFNYLQKKDKLTQEDIEKIKINEIFYKISESFCHVITNINNVDFNIIDLQTFCSDLNEAAQILTQFNSSLRLG